MKNQPSIRIAFDLPVSQKTLDAFKNCYGDEYIIDELIELMVIGLKRQVSYIGDIDAFILDQVEQSNIAAEEMELV